MRSSPTLLVLHNIPWFPDAGEYSVVVMNTFEPPDKSDFIKKRSEYDSAGEIELPHGDVHDWIHYYVYSADGEMWTRQEWHARTEEGELS